MVLKVDLHPNIKKKTKETKKALILNLCNSYFKIITMKLLK